MNTTTFPGQYPNNNTALGENALNVAITDSTTTNIGYDNTAYGDNALENLYDGINENTAVGSQALRNALSGENSAFGAHSGANLGTGTGNTLVGNWAGRFVNSGNYNTAHGFRAMSCDQIQNTAPISFAVGSCFNTATGAYAMRNFVTGNNNTANGFGALENITTGYSNTAIGSGAGTNVTVDNNNTLIGSDADIVEFSTISIPSAGAQYRTAIGSGVKAIQDNTVVIGRPELDYVGIGTNTPSVNLHVVSKNSVTSIQTDGNDSIGILATSVSADAGQFVSTSGNGIDASSESGNAGQFTAVTGDGIFASSQKSNGIFATSLFGHGLYASATSTTTTSSAVYAENNSSTGVGITAKNSNGVALQTLGGVQSNFVLFTPTTGTNGNIYSANTNDHIIIIANNVSGVQPIVKLPDPTTCQGSIFIVRNASSVTLNQDPIITAQGNTYFVDIGYEYSTGLTTSQITLSTYTSATFISDGKYYVRIGS